MKVILKMKRGIVHRRTGGLETKELKRQLIYLVHRRTGGLENSNNHCQQCFVVHRRTGGLEIKK